MAVLAVAGCGGGGEASDEQKVSGGCTEMAAPPPRPPGDLPAPSTKLGPDTRYDVVVDTNCGSFTITLDQKIAPKTAASFVFLVRRGYFNDTIFHRIVPGFVIQGGDPTATGEGGPGYTTVEPPPQATRYVRYAVAMAKTQTEPPGAAGSQFFVVTAPDANLTPDYALLGKVTAGRDVVDRIGKLGDQVTQEPTRTVVVDQMSVHES